MVKCGVLFEVRTDFLKYYLDELLILNYLTFQIVSAFSNKKINVMSSPIQTFATHHPVFTLILSLLERRTSIAWVPSNKMILLPPEIKHFFLFPKFSFRSYSSNILPNFCLFYRLQRDNWGTGSH
jgi:hypothetical protein